MLNRSERGKRFGRRLVCSKRTVELDVPEEPPLGLAGIRAAGYPPPAHALHGRDCTGEHQQSPERAHRLLTDDGDQASRAPEVGASERAARAGGGHDLVQDHREEPAGDGGRRTDGHTPLSRVHLSALGVKREGSGARLSRWLVPAEGEREPSSRGKPNSPTTRGFPRRAACEA